MPFLLLLALGLGGLVLTSKPKEHGPGKRIKLSRGKALVLGTKRRLGRAGPRDPDDPDDPDEPPGDSFMNPCDESRMLGQGVPRYTTLEPNPDFPDQRDVCEGGECLPVTAAEYWDPERGDRPYTYFDHELHRLHLSRGMAGAEAARKSIRTMGCQQGKWRPLPSDVDHHWCPSTPHDEERVTYRGQTMVCRDGRWKRDD